LRTRPLIAPGPGAIKRSGALGPRRSRVANDEVIIAFEEAGGMNALAVRLLHLDHSMACSRTCRPTCRPSSQRPRAKLPTQAARQVGWQASVLGTKDQITAASPGRPMSSRKIWYPSSGYLQQEGHAYRRLMYGAPAEEFNARPPAERLHIAKEQGEKLHPGYSNYVEHGPRGRLEPIWISRAWLGNESDPAFPLHAVVLATPQGRFRVAGDQVTYYAGWQEGGRDQRLGRGQVDRPPRQPTANRG